MLEVSRCYVPLTYPTRNLCAQSGGVYYMPLPCDPAGYSYCVTTNQKALGASFKKAGYKNIKCLRNVSKGESGGGGAKSGGGESERGKGLVEGCWGGDASWGGGGWGLN
ncbi:hypothetical protein KVT40_008945 [Elsinoe batatas]|uniref:Uncharacterized protein n=1 Tax=Elsinoe batatas TaxID=2601811 RepID=A0A8K0PFW4_9PEZI|nr:hypothetical protein KVT40_008945 [Elsinoe batatas]